MNVSSFNMYTGTHETWQLANQSCGNAEIADISNFHNPRLTLNCPPLIFDTSIRWSYYIVSKPVSI